MPRSPRILFDGAVYHIYQRGNNKDFIFKDPNHKAFFIKQLKDYTRRFDYQVLAYVIMDNHYHLLIRTNKDTIDEIMFIINNVVAKFLSRVLKRTGHIYENRYHCKVVDNDAYLLWLLRYIHRNPIRAGICENLKDYKWCSHAFYKNNISCFIDINFILDIISSNRSQAINQYLALMDLPGCNSDNKTDFNIINTSYNFNTTPYYTNDKTTKQLCRLTLDDIFNSVHASPDIIQLIKQGSKEKVLTSYKILFLKAALYNKYSLVEIGRYLNTSADALRKFKDYHKVFI